MEENARRLLLAVNVVLMGEQPELRQKLSRWLTELEKDWDSCRQISLAVLSGAVRAAEKGHANSGLVKELTPECPENKVELLWESTVTLVSQFIHKGVKRRSFLGAPVQEKVEMRMFLMSFLKELSRPALSSAAFVEKVRVQSSLALAALCVQGSVDNSWPPVQVIPDLSREFDTGEQNASQQRIFVGLLLHIAEQISDEDISIPLQSRSNFVDTFRQLYSNRVIAYLEQLALVNRSNPGGFTVIIKCLSAWIVGRMIGLSQKLYESQLLIDVLAVTPNLASDLAQQSRIAGTPKADLLSEIFELVRSIGDAASGISFKDAIALELSKTDPAEHVLARARTRQTLLTIGVPALEKAISRLVDLDGRQDEWARDDAEKLAANATSALSSIASAALSGYEELLVLGAHWETKESIEAFLTMSSPAFECMLNCLQIPSMEVQSSTFEFWFFCQRVLRSILMLRNSLPAHHQFMSVLQSELFTIASTLEIGIRKIIEQSSAFPSDEVYYNNWGDDQRTNFKLHRRDVRDVLRELFQDQVDLTNLLRKEDETEIHFQIRFLDWILSGVVKWKDNVLQSLDQNSPSAYTLSSPLEDRNWRQVEALLHSLSAITRYISTSDSHVQGRVTAIIQNMHEVLTIGTRSPESARVRVKFHRALVRTVSIFCGVLAKVKPSSERVGETRAPCLLDITFLSLYISEFDFYFPFRDAEDHSAAVAFGKICLSDIYLKQTAFLLRGGGVISLQNLVSFFKNQSLVELSRFQRVEEDQVLPAYVDFLDLDSVFPSLSSRSTELLLQGLMRILFILAVENPETICNTITDGLREILSEHLELAGLGSNLAEASWTVAGTSSASAVWKYINAVRFLSVAIESTVRVLGSHGQGNKQERKASLVIFDKVWIELANFFSIGGNPTIETYCFGKESASPVLLDRSARFFRAYVALSWDLPVEAELLHFLRVVRTRVPLFVESALSLDQIETGEVQTLLSMLTDLVRTPKDSLMQQGVVVDAVLGLIYDLCSSVTELSRRVGFLSSRSPQTAVSCLRLFSAVVTEWLASPQFKFSTPDQQKFVAKILRDMCRVAISLHSNKDILTMQSSTIQSQDLASSALQLERVTIIGGCSDSVDPFVPLPDIPSQYIELRNHLFVEGGLGRELMEGLFLGGAGQLPPWAIDRISLIMRSLLGQFQPYFLAWLDQILSDPNVPNASISAKTREIFREDVMKEKNQLLPSFKRLLKKFCGGKRKGEAVNRPSDKVKVREAFVK